MPSNDRDIGTPKSVIVLVQSIVEMFPGIGEIRKGYLYGSDKPGLGVDIDEALVAKNPLGSIEGGGAYPTGRTIDGTVVKP